LEPASPSTGEGKARGEGPERQGESRELYGPAGQVAGKHGYRNLGITSRANSSIDRSTSACCILPKAISAPKYWTWCFSWSQRRRCTSCSGVPKEAVVCNSVSEAGSLTVR